MFLASEVALPFVPGRIAIAQLPQTSTAPTATIDAADKDAVQRAMPHEVVVAGLVSDIKSTDSVITFVFAGADQSQFNAVVLRRGREAVEKVHGVGLKSLIGKHVQLTGKIALYQEKPQIVISDAKQIAVLDDSKPANSDAKNSSAKPATIIEAGDKTAIDSALPQFVAVTGTIKDISENDGVTTINFDGADESQFYAVVLQRNREAVEKVHGAGLKSLAGKRVRLTGKIVEYRERPEIVISAPEQIAVLEN